MGRESVTVIALETAESASYLKALVIVTTSNLMIEVKDLQTPLC